MTEPTAIFVLGGRVAPGGRATPLLARRIRTGIEAARRWPDALVIACGGRVWDGAVEADVIARAMTEAIDRSRLACDRVSFTTVENLREGAEIARSRGKMGRFAIVTCDWHLPRALAVAERIGIDAVGVPAASGASTTTTRWMRAVHEAIALRLDLARVRLHAAVLATRLV